jgi:hypothetical protein
MATEGFIMFALALVGAFVAGLAFGLLIGMAICPASKLRDGCKCLK